MAERTVSIGTLLKGAAAGAIATWAMGKATTWMYEWESRDARDREESARGGESAYARAAERIAESAGVELEQSQASRGGVAIHWATGIGAGVAYAAARQRWPAVASANGLPFGIGFFLLVDEGMNTAFGLTPPPGAFPWQAHARGVGGHIVYGMLTDLVLRRLDRLGPSRVLRPQSTTHQRPTDSGRR